MYRYHAKHLTYIIAFKSEEVGFSIISTLQLKKVKLREVKEPPQATDRNRAGIRTHTSSLAKHYAFPIFQKIQLSKKSFFS